jgi:glycosyltransferase involved in cell wall biosynthesis|tara:strand:- start:4969 stop:6057 length:1089 start_codon:yes stop_codon:yes gene_type:complete
MNIAVCANHSLPHFGGTEYVIQHIAESMVNEYDHDATIISRSLHKPMMLNGVSYLRCPTDFKDLFKLLKRFEHILIYSDYFCHWMDFLKNAEQLMAKKTIVLVGMNAMMASHGMMRQFIAKKQHFNVVTHSDYQDFVRCQELKIPVRIIPNGVDLSEFDNNIDFRKKYAICKNVILCISNFFPGKGQEYLIKVLNTLNSQRKDFVAVFISTTVNFSYAKFFSQKCQQELNKLGIPHKFLVDIPREDTIAAFLNSEVLAFPSQKEVAPIVILESMAARLPWIALPVGNIPKLKGGELVPYRGKDQKGQVMYDQTSYDVFAAHLNFFLDNPSAREEFGKLGRQDVEQNYNWNNIAKEYNELFTT